MRAYSLRVTVSNAVSRVCVHQEMEYAPTYDTAVDLSIVASWRRSKGAGSTSFPCPSPTPSTASYLSVAHSSTSRATLQLTLWSVPRFPAHGALKTNAPSQATVCQSLSSYSSYRDSRSPLPIATQHANLAQSATVYVGNLSFFTTEEQVRLISSSPLPHIEADGLGVDL